MTPSITKQYRRATRKAKEKSKRRNGLDDTYDAYPWSEFYREEVMCSNKIPKPPYFLQLPSGKRPDTVVLRNVPVSWFLDTPEEVKEERERELRETEVAKFPGARTITPGGTAQLSENTEPESDSPFWFTKHGHILIQAACMKFGRVKNVDLVFEMESRDVSDYIYK